jgi:pimeloyl-ACP methyl ester carboxylesterase
MKMKLLAVVPILLILLILVVMFRPKPKMTLPPNARAGDLTLEPCEYKTKARAYRAECGTLVVPESRLSPDPRLIALPVKRIHAQSDSPREPIVYFGGGPGMSNMRFDPPDELLASHDVLLVGYRGVDGSSVLDCPEYAKATLGDGRSVTSDESLAMMTDAVRACRERLESAGVDLTGYTMQDVVEDVEAARVALGYDRMNLLSESYGTRVAQIYAALHPESVFRSAMIGVNPPGRFVWEPQMVDSQIEQYVRLWSRDEAARARSQNLAETMKRVSHNMPRRWLFFPIDAGKVNAMAFVLFFNRNTSAIVFDAYVAADHGDPSGLALMSMAYDFFVPKSFVWGDFFAKGASADMDLTRDYTADLRDADSIIGSPISLMVWAPLSKAWTHETLPQELREVRPSEVETLLISGSVDFSTPAEYARDELLPSLKNCRQVIISEAGHVGDVWGVQPEATLRLLTTFYDTGVADDSLYQYAPMDFNVKLGFPLLAKILLGTGVMLVMALILGANRLVMKRR